MNKNKQNQTEARSHFVLTKRLGRREQQVLKLLLAEYTPTEISQYLNIHLNTVCGARRSVMTKWGVNSMVGLVKEAILRGYIDLDKERKLPYAKI